MNVAERKKYDETEANGSLPRLGADSPARIRSLEEIVEYAPVSPENFREIALDSGDEIVEILAIGLVIAFGHGERSR